MAPLAQSSKIIEAIIGFIMVYMGNGQYYFAAGYWVGLIVFSPTPFTLILCPFEPD